MPNQTSRRGKLKDVKFADSVNASLWLDKFIENQDTSDTRDNSAGTYKQKLINQLTQVSVPEIYKNGFFLRWKESLEDIGAKFKTFKLDGRMIVGLGGESVLEASIALHRNYGVPYIPGSALKGLAAAYAHKHLDERWHKETKKTKLGDFHRLVFGSQDFAGIVTFHDAILIPDSDNLPLHNEVMTVHHSDYYGDKDAPPADWDSPNPIPFLSASGSYLLALSAEAGLENVIEKTFDILKSALQEEGIGAKTSSGYGRGHFEKSDEEIAAERESRDVEGFIERVKAIRNTAGEIGNFVDKLKKSGATVQSKKRMAQAIVEKVNRDWKGGKQKHWYQELMDLVSK
jgi:CRISPR-associated protein Cmr6